MAKSINSFLPVYEETHRRIQGLIGAKLAKKADAIRKKRKLTWNEVMTGLLEKFVEDLYPKTIVHASQEPAPMTDDEIRQMHIFADDRMVK